MIRILIPLDGSPVAEESLIHAIAIAKTFPAEQILLRVIAESDTGAAVRMDSIDFALWRHQARAYLDRLLDRYACPSQAFGRIFGRDRTKRQRLLPHLWPHWKPFS